ncbi:hypothetical protein [Spongiimicrobium salis]|uniref:hypothetical protein n=1 Tax=Spongiimicrobium salis TaxID=1667022 RepID=UPI00374D1532
MKKIYFLFVVLLGFSCNEPGDVLDDNFQRGALIVFDTRPETTRINALDIENYTFSAVVSDPGNNVTAYELRLIYEDIVVNNFISLSSFPATLEFTGQDILSALNLTAEEIDPSRAVQLIATLTIPSGTFDGAVTDFNTDENIQEGGDSSGVLFIDDNLAFNQAINFRLSFFIPPPRRLRGTSFEEPFGTGFGSDYTRPDTEEDVTAELMNNPGERSVMYSAVGSGPDDEIGFRTFFESTGDGGFTSEEIGVTTATGEVGAFIDGEQGYQLEDIDGLLRLTFDEVLVDPATNPSSGIRIQFFPRATSWEADDTLTIFANITRADGSTDTLELTNISGAQIDELEGRWNVADTGFMPDVVSYVLIIEAVVDSGNEDIYFDEMLVFIPDA